MSLETQELFAFLCLRWSASLENVFLASSLKISHKIELDQNMLQSHTLAEFRIES